jgi:hypothetical protein
LAEKQGTQEGFPAFVLIVSLYGLNFSSSSTAYRATGRRKSHGDAVVLFLLHAQVRTENLTDQSIATRTHDLPVQKDWTGSLSSLLISAFGSAQVLAVGQKAIVVRWMDLRLLDYQGDFINHGRCSVARNRDDIGAGGRRRVLGTASEYGEKWTSQEHHQKEMEKTTVAPLCNGA